MPDRLSELVRQRALVSEHLAWLDREIANAKTATVASTIIAAPAPVSSPAAPPVPLPATIAANPVPARPSAGTLATEPDVILDQYRVAPSTVKQDVRKGCLLYFAAAFVVLGLVVTVLYMALSSH